MVAGRGLLHAKPHKCLSANILASPHPYPGTRLDTPEPHRKSQERIPDSILVQIFPCSQSAVLCCGAAAE